MRSIPFLSLAPQHDRIRAELEKSFKKVLKGGSFVLGGEVEAFEKEYAAYSGVKYCVSVANGLDALYLSLMALNIKEGDEVIVPALTCAPTWTAVSRTGATLVPVDADRRTFQLDTGKLDKAISTKTKAILPVNLYGRPANLSKILQKAKAQNIFVVEDNAQGHGAAINGRKTGSFGTINGTSFYPTKNLGALGDAGAITTDSFELAEKVKQFRNYGSAHRFQHEVVGINSRLDELQASFLRIKLKFLESWNDERRKLAAVYESQLGGVADLTMPVNEEGALPVYHLFVVCTDRRDQLREFLRNHGIETDVHYPTPPHLQKAFAYLGALPGNYPDAERICETILSLPLWPGMSTEDAGYVCQCVIRFFK